MRVFGLVFAAALGVGCGGNPYSYARTYEPLSAEKPWLEQTTEISYEEARRDPEGMGDRLLSWFGVVTQVKPAAGDHRLVAMTLRFHQPRPLCADHSDSSCRVTVSEKERGSFSALVTLREQDASGPRRVWGGSLLRVYGKVTGEFDELGGPVVRAEYYRHWPPGTYVTTGARGAMRR